MIEHIRLKEHKGLKECELLNLGHINVLCGKNNIGKTTILECIKDTTKRFLGKSIPDDMVAQFIDFLERETSWRIYDEPRGMEAFQAFIKDALNAFPNGILFHDDRRKYENIFYELYNATKASRRYHHPDNIGYFIEDWIIDSYSTVYIAPNRITESSGNLAGNTSLQEDSSDILRNLFHMQNQLNNSPEKKTYNEIRKRFNEISSGYFFYIRSEKNSELTLEFSNDENNWYAADHSGLGLRDVLVILTQIIVNKADIYLIEEPENHIHPGMQKKLLGFCNEYKDAQFFISTHANTFLDDSFVDKVYLVSCENEVKVDDATSKAITLNMLGYSVTDNLISDLIILVEGPSDKPVLEEFLIKMDIYHKYNIKIMPLGGDIMDQVDLSTYLENREVVAIIDKDPGSTRVRNRFKKKCEEYSILCTQLERYSIENYFTLDAINEIFGSQIEREITAIRPDQKIEDQLGLCVKKKSRNIVRHMSIDDIKGTDLYDFLENVRTMLESSLSAKVSVDNIEEVKEQAR